MPARRLHLVVDADLGPALWAREQTGPGRSRALEDLAPLAAGAPEPLQTALAPLGGRLRHRVRLASGGAAGGDRRVPARALAPRELTALVTAVHDHLDRASAADALPLLERLAPLLEAGSSARLTDALIAMPDLLAALPADEAARVLVEARHVLPVLEERFGRMRARWAPIGVDGARLEDPLLGALVDARARQVLDEVLAPTTSGALAAGASKQPAVETSTAPTSGASTAPAVDSVSQAPAAAGVPEPQDPLGLLAALSSSAAPVDADIPVARRVSTAFDAFATSARATVQLASTDLELVVRLHEPPVGTAWPLQTCLREADGTVHPVADLRAVGDLTAAGAVEAAGEILRISPVVRTAAWDDTGVDWLLTTAEASTFLARDAQLLEDAGVVVMLPRQWTKVRASVRAEVADAPPEKTGPGVGLQAMASFRWRVAVGETELTEDEIQEIRDAQTELVRLRGQWVRLDSTTMRAAERFLNAFSAKARRRVRDGGEDDPGHRATPASNGTGSGAAMSGAGAASPSASPALRGMSGPSAAVPRGDGGPHGGAGIREDVEPRGYAEPRRDVGTGGDDARTGGDGGPHGDVGPGAPGTEPVPAPAPATAAQGDLTLREWFALLGGEAAEGTDVDALDVGGEMARLLDAHAQAPELPAPATLRAELRPYQRRGLDWMWFLDSHELGGILADDMGLGKTMQVLALLCREREVAAERGETVGPTLLVCPMSVVGSWQREAATFAPELAVHVHHGGARVRDASFVEGAREMDLVLTTYALMARDLPLLQRVPWHRVVLDEAQHVKNPQTAVSHAARSLPEGRRLVLTGTPVENRLADLHSLMEVANPGLLGPLARFQERIATPIETDGDPAAASRLARLTGPFLLRRVKTDRTIIRDLPEKTEITQSVNLTPEQAGLYEALVAEMMAEIDEAGPDRRRAVVVSTLTKLKQVCNHPAHFLGDGSGLLRDGAHRSGKLELVDDLLEAAFAEGEKVLLFTQFTTFGHMVAPYWSEKFGIEIPFLHGGVAKADRDTMVARFQERTDEPGAMLLSLRAGGTGLTLTAANHVVHIDRWWNPAVENQATDRAFRIGQRKDVQVRKLVSAGTVEERIDRVLADKAQLADLAVGSGEGWIATLGDDELAALLSLDAGEVDAAPDERGPGAAGSGSAYDGDTTQNGRTEQGGGADGRGGRR